jgi:hypothetical protein
MTLVSNIARLCDPEDRSWREGLECLHCHALAGEPCAPDCPALDPELMWDAERERESSGWW